MDMVTVMVVITVVVMVVVMIMVMVMVMVVLVVMVLGWCLSKSARAPRQPLVAHSAVSEAF